MIHISESPTFNFPGVELRPVSNETDFPFLCKLYASTRQNEMAHVTAWTPAQKRQFLEMQWRSQMRHYADNFPNASHLLILFESEKAGRLYVDRSRAEIHLLDISLLPPYRGRGIGSTLIEGLLEDANTRQVPVRLYVWQHNEGAARLYERLGFRRLETGGIYHFMEWVPSPLLTQNK